MPNAPTYADAIADFKAWVAHEVESNSFVLGKLNASEWRTRAFYMGRIDELHAIDKACNALLALSRMEEGK